MDIMEMNELELIYKVTGIRLESVSDLYDRKGLTKKADEKLDALDKLRMMSMANPVLNNPPAVAEFVRHLGDEPQEQIWGVFCNNMMRVISKCMLSSGSQVECLFDPYTLLAPAILMRAKVLFVVHNHPCNTMYPSSEDKEMYKKVEQVADLVHVKVMDSIIVMPAGYYSMRQERFDNWRTR